MDVDTREVARRLSEAMKSSGLSLRGFAAALGTSHSRLSSYLKGTASPSAALFVRACRIGAALGEARDQGWLTPDLAQRALKDAVDEGDEAWAFKIAVQARDQVRELLATPGAPADAWEARPSARTTDRWDALLGAFVAHEFMAADRTAPAWTDLRADEEWIKPNLLLDDAEIRDATPGWLSVRGIYVAERDLATA
ncbi:helix-turn-helix domain-containing protein [Nocardioides sp. SLBN-35]|uniref:helix-turn-helix domain-containing protein n=1 Tax=Nocardioides sp. SLBN-35 TaxID=2768445 RepID=UPI0011530F7F|nr:helix-turn-helix transcriptional regulator [Nocardioides sp. SLBN-35]TQK71006.1 helix-turn-helix protein [Nocardioides sp. SLBN-35]